MNKKIVLVGAGRIGKALAKIFAQNGYETELWDRDSSKINPNKNLKDALANADFLFLCVPAHAVREVIKSIKPYLESKTIIVSLSKGIEEETQKNIFDLLEEFFPKKQKLSLISGPMMAEELEKGLLGAGVFVSRNKKIFEDVKEIFEKTNIVLESSSDIKGITLCGVLKNIYAVGLGMVSALELGDNFRGWYVKNSIEEISRIVKALGGKEKSVLTMAGIGDLIATGFSPYSRNYKAGFAIVKRTEYVVSEGIISLPSINKILGKKIDKFIILKALKKVILEKSDPKIIFSAMNKPPH